MRHRVLLLPALLSSLLASASVHATNGYLSHGFGVKALGQAGVGIAWGQDGLAAATNPANTAEVGSRGDIGVSWFAPRRSADIAGNGFAPDASYNGDGVKNFFLPELGLTRQLGSSLAVGVAVYGNGGLNTEYANNPYARFDGSGPAGVNLEQLFVTPSIAWKPTANHSLGAALNIAYQRFSAQGIGVFSAFSAAPTNVSNKGTDDSLGVGVRLGWTGKLSPELTIGATWASKVRGKFDEYKGLFADSGRFDVPENYGIGLAYRPNSALTLGADVQTIRYSKVAAVGNSVSLLFQGKPLGSANGPGFGWRDVTVVKVAASYDVNPNLTIRGGYSHANQPVPAGETFFNILAPGVVQDHLTVGLTSKLAGGGEVSGYVARAFGKTVKGSASIRPGFPPAGLGGGNANVRLAETIVGVSYGWTF